jgi:hypothetical protein
LAITHKIEKPNKIGKWQDSKSVARVSESHRQIPSLERCHYISFSATRFIARPTKKHTEAKTGKSKKKA